MLLKKIIKNIYKNICEIPKQFYNFAVVTEAVTS